MDFTRRRLMGLFSVSATALMLENAAAKAAPAMSSLGRDAGQLGVKHNSPDDQTIPLQRAIYATAAARMPLVLRPGIYRTGELELPSGAQIVGARGATRGALRRARPRWPGARRRRCLLRRGARR